MALHFHTYELGKLLLPTTADEGGPEHTHRTVLTDGAVVETGAPVGGEAHVHMVDVRGAAISTGDAITPAEQLIAGTAKVARRKRALEAKHHVRFALAVTDFLRLARQGDIANKPPYMIAPDAPRVWVDAAKVEDLAGYPTEDGEGIALTEQHIDQMIANLKRSPNPVPVDGGGISEVHGTPSRTDTEAAGWVFDADKQVDADGVAHLHLLLELRPEVYKRMQNGGLKYGSIAFVTEAVDGETNKPIGALLDSYALTNKPFIQGLRPHLVFAEDKATCKVFFNNGPLPSEPQVITLSTADGRRPCIASKEIQQMTKTVDLASFPQTQKAILEVMGLTDTPPNELGEAMLMKVVEWKAKLGIADPPAKSKSDDKGGELSAPVTFAMTPEDEAAAGEIMRVLSDLFAAPEGTPLSALLELLNANLEAMRSVVQGAPEVPADGGQPSEPAPGTLDATPPAAPATLSVDPRTVALEAKVSALQALVDERTQIDKRAAAQKYVVHAFGSRGLKLEDEMLKSMVDIAVQRGTDAIDKALKGIKPVPPAPGQVMTLSGGAATSSINNSNAIIEAALKEVQAQQPALSVKQAKREAIKLAARRNPELFQ